MKIAIASGKGGTGKTTVAINMALVVDQAGENVVLADCDVEAPNAGLFLDPQIASSKDVGLMVPVVDQEKCTLCGRCAEVCAFNAITVVGQKVLVFPEVCHGCGSCTLNCPENAISESLFKTGVIEKGSIGKISFVQGRMEIGQMMSTPIIRQMKADLKDEVEDAVVILDSPPGASCPFMETVKDVDYVVLVTEPTPFGLHDLKKAVDIARGEFKLPVGVVINRDGIGDDQVERYCQEAGIDILLKIPYQARIAEIYSNGIPLVKADTVFVEMFSRLFTEIKERIDA